MDGYKIPFSSDLAAALAGANETMLPFRAIAKDMNDKMQPTLKSLQIYQQHFPSIHDTFGQVGLSINNIYAPMLGYQSPLLEATRVSAKWHKLLIESDALKQIRAVSEMWKTNFNAILNPLEKSDFRIGVLSQEISDELDNLLIEDELYEIDYTFYQLNPDTSLGKNQENNQADEINELKLMIVELSSKFSDFKENTSNKNLDTNQANEENKNSALKILVGFIGAFFFVCEFVEHSETAYQLLLWFQQVIQPLLNHFN